jgi:hypothetical protein
MPRGLAALLVVFAGCATSPEPSEVRPPSVAHAPKPPPPPPPPPDAGASLGATIHEAAALPADYAPDMGFKELTEKQWLQGIRDKICQRWKVTPADLRFSKARQLVAFVRTPEVPPVKKGRKPPPRKHQIMVVDLQAEQRNVFRPVTVANSDEPPKDLRFFSENRLLYEVVLPAPAPAAAATAKKARRSKASQPPKPVVHVPDKPGQPRRLLVIQPLEGRRPRAIRCDGVRFAFSAQQDRLAFVGGQPEAGFVSVDGTQRYPRRGRTAVTSDLAWSKDGHSLAFLEVRASGPPRLVLLAELDNPTGDSTWDLPASATLDGARVFWAGPGKLVVGKSIMRPLFATSFTKDRPPEPASR